MRYLYVRGILSPSTYLKGLSILYGDSILITCPTRGLSAEISRRYPLSGVKREEDIRPSLRSAQRCLERGSVSRGDAKDKNHGETGGEGRAVGWLGLLQGLSINQEANPRLCNGIFRMYTHDRNVQRSARRRGCLLSYSQAEPEEN